MHRHLHCNEEKFREYFHLTPVLFNYVLHYVKHLSSKPYNRNKHLVILHKINYLSILFASPVYHTSNRCVHCTSDRTIQKCCWNSWSPHSRDAAAILSDNGSQCYLGNHASLFVRQRFCDVIHRHTTTARLWYLYLRKP